MDLKCTMLAVVIASSILVSCEDLEDDKPSTNDTYPNQTEQPQPYPTTPVQPDAQVVPNSGTGGIPSDAGNSPPQPKKDCCEPNTVPGCTDPNAEACVCNADQKCCEEEWGMFCVILVETENCGTCSVSQPDASVPPPPAPEETDCCTPHATPGCDDQVIQTCVCTLDPKCCNEVWDEFCIIIATTASGGAPPCTSCE